MQKLFNAMPNVIKFIFGSCLLLFSWLLKIIAIIIMLIPSILLAILEAAVTSTIFLYLSNKKTADVALDVSFYIFAAINVCYKLFKIYKENQALENEINASINKNRVIPGHKLVKNLKKHNR